MKTGCRLWHCNGGYAVVEATILFPIMIMIFAALTLLAMYLPTRAALQRATQYAATALATELSDTWLFYDDSVMSYYWESDQKNLSNVYSSPLQLSSAAKQTDRAETITMNIEKKGAIFPAGTLTVQYEAVDLIICQEIIITATRIIPLPVDLFFVKFPTKIPITVTARALAQNGDEFVRNADLAVDCFSYINDKYQTSARGLFSRITAVDEQNTTLTQSGQN